MPCFLTVYIVKVTNASISKKNYVSILFSCVYFIEFYISDDRKMSNVVAKW